MRIMRTQEGLSWSVFRPISHDILSCRFLFLFLHLSHTCSIMFAISCCLQSKLYFACATNSSFVTDSPVYSYHWIVWFSSRTWHGHPFFQPANYSPKIQVVMHTLRSLPRSFQTFSCRSACAICMVQMVQFEDGNSKEQDFSFWAHELPCFLLSSLLVLVLSVYVYWNGA